MAFNFQLSDNLKIVKFPYHTSHIGNGFFKIVLKLSNSYEYKSY